MECIYKYKPFKKTTNFDQPVEDIPKYLNSDEKVGQGKKKKNLKTPFTTNLTDDDTSSFATLEL